MDKKPEGRSGAGCVVHTSDAPNIIATIACFSSFIVYGACQGSLGAALPALSKAYGKSESDFGFAFTTRGIGYLVGTVGSAALLEVKGMPWWLSKEVLVCLSVMLTGLATGLIAGVGDYQAVLFLFWMQGVGFGGVDTMANCVLPELWGVRVQPWMQALHSFFGVGAVLGPALVGGLGYYTTFIILSILSGVPLLGVVLQSVLQRAGGGDKDRDGAHDEEKYLQVAMVDVHRELTALTAVASGPECDEEARESVSVMSATDVDSKFADQALLQSSLPPPLAAASEPEAKPPPPLLVKCIITAFFFFYVGVECGYGAWISTFTLYANVTTNLDDAAFCAAIFWAALTVGRVLAIPMAVYISTTGMMRMQLLLSTLGAILTLTIAKETFALACVASAVLGYALSSIFPLAMTLVLDYNRSMDGATTSMFVVGSTFGEGIIPVCIGLAMNAGGAMILPYSVCAVTLVLLILYFAAHELLRKK